MKVKLFYILLITTATSSVLAYIVLEYLRGGL
jgi:hypothetical protein